MKTLQVQDENCLLVICCILVTTNYRKTVFLYKIWRKKIVFIALFNRKSLKNALNNIYLLAK